MSTYPYHLDFHLPHPRSLPPRAWRNRQRRISGFLTNIHLGIHQVSKYHVRSVRPVKRTKRYQSDLRKEQRPPFRHEISPRRFKSPTNPIREARLGLHFFSPGFFELDLTRLISAVYPFARSLIRSISRQDMDVILTIF
jgi:hypothetical protein